MSDNQFMKLFKSIEEVKLDVRDARENMATKDNIDGLQNQLDGIAARLDDDDTRTRAPQARLK